MRSITQKIGLVAAAVLAAGGLNVTPAAAAPMQGVVQFDGVANIVCFGCGTSTGTATLVGCGVTIPPAVPCGSATASYSVTEGTGTSCVVTGSAAGSVTGFVNVTFTWLRVGAAAVITSSGDINGAGVAAFVVTSPLGPVCGGPVTARVVGALVGV